MNSINLTVFSPGHDELATILEVHAMKRINDDDPEWDKSANASIYIVATLFGLALALTLCKSLGWPMGLF